MNNSNRLPWILVGILTGLNIAVLATLWLRPNPAPPPFPPPPPWGGPPPGRGMGLPMEIGMAPERMEKAKPLGESHMDKMEGIRDSIIDQRLKAFEQFGEPTEDSLLALQAFQKIGQLQLAAEAERYRHFHELLALCSPEEAQRLKSLLPRVLARKGQPENRDTPPPHGPHGPHGHHPGPPPPHE